MERGLSSNIPSLTEISSSMDLKELTRISTTRGYRNVLGIWLLIGFTMAIMIGLWHQSTAWTVVLLPVGIAVIATFQNALIQLMHEAAHGLLHPRRKLNCFGGLLLLGLPLGVPFFQWRADHLAHHRHLGTEKDPDWHYYQEPPSTRRELLRQLIIAGSGIIALMRLKSLLSNSLMLGFQATREGRNGWYLVEACCIYGTHVAGLTIICLLGRWHWVAFYLVLWVVPFITVERVIHQWRLWAEHGWVRANEGRSSNSCNDPLVEILAKTRSTIGNRLLRRIIGPFGINYHVEHHLFPGVPEYSLPSIHKILIRHPILRRRLQAADSYVRF